MAEAQQAVLEVRGLKVEFPGRRGVATALSDVSFSIRPGEILGVVGESGAGKSMTGLAIQGLLERPGHIAEGEIWLADRRIDNLGDREMEKIRGREIGAIFQDPLTSLNPLFTVGAQLTETIRQHLGMSKAEAKTRAISLLKDVGIPSPEERVNQYPHQFSGGMRQRVMIAMALILKPSLVIADEPTTALDVTVQAQIVALLDAMRKELGTTVILITHDLGLLSSVADDVMVMYGGHRMEYGKGSAVFRAPAHPYTAGLLKSSPANYSPGAELVPIKGRPPSLLATPAGCVFAPRCGDALAKCSAQKPPLQIYSDGIEALCWREQEARGARSAAVQPAVAVRGPDKATEPVVVAKDVHLTYQVGSFFGKRRTLEVLKGIDLTVAKGETVGLVGESGCGKSTFARVVAGLTRATSGSVELLGQDIGTLDPARWREMRKHAQLVFQDPFGSLNPRRRVGAIIGDPFRLHGVAQGEERKQKVRHLMEVVGLNPEHYNRFPSEFSGGQRQRIGIARALALNPSLIIRDEPVSALDVSVQAQVLNLLRRLQHELNLTYLFISHDLSVVRHVSDRIAVMQG